MEPITIKEMSVFLHTFLLFLSLAYLFGQLFQKLKFIKQWQMHISELRTTDTKRTVAVTTWHLSHHLQAPSLSSAVHQVQDLVGPSVAFSQFLQPEIEAAASSLIQLLNQMPLAHKPSH